MPRYLRALRFCTGQLKQLLLLFLYFHLYNVAMQLLCPFWLTFALAPSIWQRDDTEWRHEPSYLIVFWFAVIIYIIKMVALLFLSVVLPCTNSKQISAGHWTFPRILGILGSGDSIPSNNEFFIVSIVFYLFQTYYWIIVLTFKYLKYRCLPTPQVQLHFASGCSCISPDCDERRILIM